jgi:hypothetical protein
MTYVGVPSIHYGDEVGMKGENHMSRRACMPWDATIWDEDLRLFHQKLIALRRNSPALIRGGSRCIKQKMIRLHFCAKPRMKRWWWLRMGGRLRVPRDRFASPTVASLMGWNFLSCSPAPQRESSKVPCPSPQCAPELRFGEQACSGLR